MKMISNCTIMLIWLVLLVTSLTITTNAYTMFQQPQRQPTASLLYPSALQATQFGVASPPMTSSSSSDPVMADDRRRKGYYGNALRRFNVFRRPSRGGSNGMKDHPSSDLKAVVVAAPEDDSLLLFGSTSVMERSGSSAILNKIQQQQQRRVSVVRGSMPKPLDVVARSSVGKVSASTASTTSTTDFTEKRSGLIHSLTKNALEGILTSRLQKWSDKVDVIVQPCTNHNKVLNLARGQFQCDATVNLQSRIKFGRMISMTQGKLEVKRLRLNLWNFVAQQQKKQKEETERKNQQQDTSALRPRYLQQFDFIGHNLTMTQLDLFESECIRNGLVRLLTRILTNRGLSPKKISIESISILDCGKISVRGKAIPTITIPSLSNSSPTPSVEFPFEVRSSIGTTSRGHVVTFPGLELSLTPDAPGFASFFVPIFPELTVDLGSFAQINSIAIDAITKQIILSAKVTITPEQSTGTYAITSQFQQSAQSFAAMCSVDVGRWLTKVGRFAH